MNIEIPHERYQELLRCEEVSQKQYEKIKELEKKLAIAKEALEDFILEDEHLPDCRFENYGYDYPCKCMDRNHYNRDACMLRARLALKQLNE